MTRRSPAYILGYHGCRTSVANLALSGQPLTPSEKDYDWLGPGVYFWESDPIRAHEWAEDKYGGDADGPTSIGAMIDLGNCLDLTLRENFRFLQTAYEDLVNSTREARLPLPENRNPRGIAGDDKLLRFLDCAVIKRLHSLMATAGVPKFDTVRGMFIEGEPVYPNARFHDKTHTQIAVISPECIKAVFVPRAC